MCILPYGWNDPDQPRPNVVVNIAPFDPLRAAAAIVDALNAYRKKLDDGGADT